MKKGDLVEVTMNWKSPPSVRYIVRVEEISDRGIQGPYAWQPDGAMNTNVGTLGAFYWNEIDEFKTLEILNPFKDGDVLTHPNYRHTYRRIDGRWWHDTDTDESVRKMLDHDGWKLNQ